MVAHAMTASLVADIMEDRRKVTEHSLYEMITSTNMSASALRTFMQYHVWAIYDYFLLLKRLQNDFTCTRVPWRPTKDATMRRFIQEIVLEEESDVFEDGTTYGSHLELYLRGMNQIGADTKPMRDWLHLLEEREGLNDGLGDEDLVPVLVGLGAPLASALHVASTMELVRNGTTGDVAAVFAFGREDLIPNMFARLLRGDGDTSWLKKEPNTSIFRYYLERHIELDGDDHGPLSLKMVEGCLGVDAEEEGTRQKWHRATKAVQNALRMRCSLWDGISDAVSSV